MSHRIAYNCKYDSALVGFATEAGQAAWSGLGSATRGIVCAGRKVVKQSGNWETEMDRLSASGAIAGSKEPWTCRADATPRRRPGNRPGGLRAAGSRAVASARRAAAFPVLCAMLAAPLLGAGGSAQAEELVSNLSDSASSTSMRLGTATGSVDAVQLFTTGTNAGGYTLTSIELSLYRGGGLGTAGIRMPAVKLHAVTVTGTSVTLGTEVATLTTSLPFPGATVETYMAPMGTALGRSTTYGVFVEGGGNGVYWDRAASGDENATPAANWSIGDQAATRAHDATAGLTLGTDGPGMIRVNGEATTTTNNPPTVANLIPNQTAMVGTALNYAFPTNTFADTDAGDTLTYTATQSDDSALPAWLSFAPGTRTFSGTPATADVGTVSVKVTASDGTESVSDTFDIVVSAAAGVTVSKSALTVTEEDTTGNTYTVVLDTRPTADVTVMVFGHGGTDVTLTSLAFTSTTPSSVTLTFTTAMGTRGWNLAQTVTVKAGNDTDTTNDTVTLTHHAASTDGNYDGITIGSVVVTVADNDTTNNAPTSAIGFVDTNEDEDYTFSSADFTFTDTDTGDSLASVKIVTLPASGTGTLTLSGTAIPSTDLPKTVPAADLGNLKYSPPANLNGYENFATFGFKVNDGTDDSVDTYRINIDVVPMNDPVTGKPGIAGTAQVGRRLTATVGTIADVDGLPNPFFSAATTTVQWIQVDGGNESDISGATSGTYALATADEGKKIKVKVSFEDGDGTVEGPLTSDAYPSSGTVIGAVNAAPTGADKTLTIGSDTEYTLTAEDFGFADVNIGDTLDSVRIVTVPGLGTLALDGTAVSLNDVIPSADIDDNKLTFTPVAGATGEAYTIFTFKVNDGTVDSDNAYTMTFNVRVLSCAVPRFGSRREHWYGEVTVEAVEVNATIVGYGLEQSSDAGSLAPNAFMIGSNSYTIFAAYVQTAPLTEGAFVLGLEGSDLTTAEAAALKVYVCDSGGLDFSDAGHRSNQPAYIYTWNNASLDWSPPVATRTLYLSLPANRAATGEPAISGTATAGQVLTATTGTIADADGLPSSFTYQWLRVDADGTSNEEDISGEIAATYTLTTADVDKKVKVKVSFTDDLSGEEERTSDAYPSSGTVTGTTNTAATGAPAITGTAESGHVLTAAAGTIADADGLSGDYTYQWVRVDADGTSNPTPISGATYATYALTAADEGKRVKVQVSFIDDLGNGETRSSAAYPSSGTVAAGSCPAPDLDGRRRVWTGMLAVGPIHVQLSMAIQGYGFQTGRNSNPGGALNPTQFNVGPNGYMIDEASVFNDGNLRFSLTSSLTAAQRAVLRLHVCDTDYDFSSATHNSSGHSYFWDEGLDWSSESTRTLHLSLETIVNRAATGAPTISGLPAVGHRLSAGIAGIADEDGLPSSFTYQWLQVDADGTSNEEAISGANAATYTVAATDVGKRVKVRVSFIDSLGGGETLTSDAFPLSGTVYMAVVPDAPQNITASMANTRVVLGWEAPANDGGAPITKYQYRASADSGTSWSPDWTDVADGSDAGSDVSDERGVTVTGLTNGTGYTFEVRAVNSAGGGAVATATANPGAVCAAPDFGTRRNIWTGTVEVEAIEIGGVRRGYGFNSVSGAGSLADNTFSIGSNDYTVSGIIDGVGGVLSRLPDEQPDERGSGGAEAACLRNGLRLRRRDPHQQHSSLRV